MKIILYGATGMVGQGVLRECLQAPDVDQVLIVGRTPIGIHHPKFSEILLEDFLDYSNLTEPIQGYDACFFCLGISSSGLTEAMYTQISFSFTLAAAEYLVALNPQMTFTYVSGAGTDSTEKSSTMWARVKGRTENALLRLPFRSVFLFRPGIIRPLHGIQSKTKLYRIFYQILGPFLGLFQRRFPKQIATTESIGLAMLNLTRSKQSSQVIESSDIHLWANAPTIH